jgi:hypothetical protein
MAAKSNRVKGFIGEGLAEINEAAMSLSRSIRAYKLRYSLFSLLFLILLGIFVPRVLMNVYALGSLQGSSFSKAVSASMDLTALEMIQRGEIQEAEKLLEINVDSHTLGIFMFGYSQSVPWYIKIYGYDNFYPEATKQAVLSRVASHRLSHPSSSPLFQPGQPNYEELMTYAPSDSTVGHISDVGE